MFHRQFISTFVWYGGSFTPPPPSSSPFVQFFSVAKISLKLFTLSSVSNHWAELTATQRINLLTWFIQLSSDKLRSSALIYKYKSEIFTVKVLNRRNILNLNCRSMAEDEWLSQFIWTLLEQHLHLLVLYLSFYHGKSNWPKICTKTLQYLQQLDTPKNLSTVKYISHHKLTIKSLVFKKSGVYSFIICLQFHWESMKLLEPDCFDQKRKKTLILVTDLYRINSSDLLIISKRTSINWTYHYSLWKT